MSLIPETNPKIFTFSAVVVGFLLIDDLTANEQNALGNWLMLVAQTLCTNAYYKQVEQERYIKNNYNMKEEDIMLMLEKMINALQNEVNDIKKTSH